MPLAESAHRLTEAEYLKLERAAEFRSEFLDGEMFAMPGGSPRHSLIVTNLARELSIQLRTSPCVTYNADLRVKVEATGLFTYPDLPIICGDLRLAAGTDDTVVNPTVKTEGKTGLS